MATVHIPALLRDLTGDAEQTKVEIASGQAITIAELLRRLEQRFPGLAERLVDGERLVPGMAVFIGDEQARMGLLAKVRQEDEVYFLAPIVGGISPEG